MSSNVITIKGQGKTLTDPRIKPLGTRNHQKYFRLAGDGMEVFGWFVKHGLFKPNKADVRNFTTSIQEAAQ